MLIGIAGFRNLRVGTKLMLGFAVVLFLNLLVALSALNGQREMEHRLDVMKLEESLRRQALQIRLAEKEYTISLNPSAKSELELGGRNMSDTLGKLAPLLVT